MAYGIAQELDQLKGLSIQELMQRQSVDPQLVYAIALQEKQKMEAAKERQAAMGMQPPEGTVVNQMEQNLAQRMAPGVQMQGQRSMPARQPQMAQGMPAPQPQQGRGISAVPAPNMKSMGMAMGGIVGYAGPDGSVVGANSKGPIPKMSPEENAQMLKYLEGLKKFDYYDKNPDKVSPEGRQALELERRMFEEQFPSAFKQKVSDMMYGPSEGMAMGGDVKGYAGPDGSTVSSDNVAMPYKLGDKYYVDGKEISQTDYAALLNYAEELKAAQLVNRGAFDENDRRGSRPFYAPGSQADRLFSGIRGIPSAIAGIPSAIAGSASRMGKVVGDAASKDVGRVKEAIGSITLPDVSINASDIVNSQTPQQNRGGGMAPAVEQLISSLGPQDYSVTDEERRAIKQNENAAPAPAPVASTPSDRRLNSMAGVDEQALRTALGAAMQTAEQKRNMQGADKKQEIIEEVDKKDPPKEGGIRSALAKTKPFLDKAMGVAGILGRGAGASKGYEFSQIAEEGRKIKEAEANRANRLEEQRMMLEGRKAELDARNAAAMNMSAAEYQAELTDENIMMSNEYRRIEAEKLGTAGEGFLASPFNILTDAEEAKIALEMQEVIKDIRARKLKEFKSVLGQASGASEQAGVSTAPTNFADYNPTT